MSQFEIMLWLLWMQGILGAFDTIYFHEWRAQLPALQSSARRELTLHCARDQIYAVLFLTLPWLEWRGLWTWVLAVLLIAEIMITMWDFVVEDLIRKPLGGVYPAERVLHGILGVLYGLFLAALIPLMRHWYSDSSSSFHGNMAGPMWLKYTMSLMGILSTLSGLRDLFAAYGLPYSSWPWSRRARAQAR
jgi:hypothetical protein